MDNFNFSVTVSGGAVPAQIIQQPGNYIYYRKATTGTTNPEIQVKTDTGEIAKLNPGEGYTFSQRFGSFIITNSDNALTVAGQLVTGEGMFQANRIVGEVSVIDASVSRTVGGAAFMLHQYCAAVAAQYPHVQLWNPAGSGVDLVLTKMALFCTTTQVIYIGSKAAALATAGGTSVNKKIGNAGVSLGLGKKENNAVQQLSNIFSGTLTGSALPVVWPIGNDIVIPPGQGYGTMGNVVNQDIGAEFDYYERPAS